MLSFITLYSSALADVSVGHVLDPLLKDTFSERRRAADDAFTVLFFADLENDYRGHSPEHSRRNLEYMRDIGSKGLRFDGEFSDVKIDPQLYIHGGDINRDGWASGWDPAKDFWWAEGGLHKTPDDEFNKVWNALYEPVEGRAGKPTLSIFGNHDWVDADRDRSNGGVALTDGILSSQEQHESNLKSLEFVRKTMEKSKPFGVTYKAIQPDGNTGPVHYVAEFNGIQIVLLQNDGILESYDWNNVAGGQRTRTYTHDNQIDRVVDAIDKSKTTLFTTHFPLTNKNGGKAESGCANREEAEDCPLRMPSFEKMLKDFAPERAAIFTGHNHWASRRDHVIAGKTFTDYTAPYPWAHLSEDKTSVEIKAGAYAVLVSPSAGVLQVKQVELRPKCWEDGTRCTGGALGTCETQCCYRSDNYEYWYSKAWHACGMEPKWDDGSICALGTSCNACKNEATFWHSKVITACGNEPKWNDGDRCALGTSCKMCKTKATYWYGKAWTACGNEPKWNDGSICALGTSCNACKNKATFWHGKVITACGNEPKWNDGDRCALGTSCKMCKNKARYWYAKAWTACGNEPKWADGTICGLGTTCNACKNKASWWWSKFFTACGSE